MTPAGTACSFLLHKYRVSALASNETCAPFLSTRPKADMKTSTQRPVHLNLLKIRLPIGGIMSIIHRITGVAMFVAIPVLIYLLDLSLRDAASYQAAGVIVRSPFGVILLFGLMWGISLHLLAGIRFY